MHKRISIIILLFFFTLFLYSQTENIEVQNAQADALWSVFLENPASNRAADILITLGSVGKGNRNIINNLNNFLFESSRSFRSGSAVNYAVLSACIEAIVELGDSSSYQALFSVIYAGFPEVIEYEAFGALDAIPGNLFQFLQNVLRNNPLDEKLAAFRAAINSRRLTVYERGQIAELVLEQALAADEENIYFNMMRYAAVLALTQLRWERASPLAIRHYYRVQSDYLRRAVPKERFLEAIALLGAIGTPQATLALGLQLGLINTRTERTGYFDTEITKAVIQALGLIGDNGAFDQLLHASSLSYTEDIQVAAREAISRLRWVR